MITDRALWVRVIHIYLTILNTQIHKYKVSWSTLGHSYIWLSDEDCFVDVDASRWTLATAFCQTTARMSGGSGGLKTQVFGSVPPHNSLWDPFSLIHKKSIMFCTTHEISTLFTHAKASSFNGHCLWLRSKRSYEEIWGLTFLFVHFR